MSKIKDLFINGWQLLKETFKEFRKREPIRNSAVIAYFAILSMPGLLLIVINTAAAVHDRSDLQEKVRSQVGALIGGQAAADINGILVKVQENNEAKWANVLSWATLLFGATGIFHHLQRSLNAMWGVKADPDRKLLVRMRERLFSFGMIMVLGILLIISLVISTVLAAASQWLSDLAFKDMTILFQVLDIGISMVVLTALFAATFKFLPNADIPWRSVWIGAFITTVLFLMAKYALGQYFGKADPSAVYGSASSLVLVMLWVTFIALIILYGAEFSLTYARRHGFKITPQDEGSGRQ